MRGAERLIQAAQKLTTARTMEDVSQMVQRAAREVTGADGAAFILREEDQSYYADEDAIAPLWKGQRFPLCSCIAGWAMVNRQTAIIKDIHSDPRIQVETFQTTFVKSLMVAPIRVADPIGAIACYWAEPYLASMEETRLLQALADIAMVALDNTGVYEKLEHQILERTQKLETAVKLLSKEISLRKHMETEIRALSLQDELTTVFSPRAFMLLAEQEMKSARRTQISFAFVFIQLENATAFCEHHGEEYYNQVLIEIARFLRRCFREADVIARIDEHRFVVLAGDGQESAISIGRRLQLCVDNYNQAKDYGHRLALNLDIIRWQPSDRISLEGVMAKADEIKNSDMNRKRIA